MAISTVQPKAIIPRSGEPKQSSTIAAVQGTYFLLSGLWPLLHYRSFEKVTGPKRDDWLVKTVGVLVACVGGSLILSRRDPGPGRRFLAMSSALGLTAVDTYFASKGRISKIYLLDAAAEVMFAAAWLDEPGRERD